MHVSEKTARQSSRMQQRQVVGAVSSERDALHFDMPPDSRQATGQVQVTGRADRTGRSARMENVDLGARNIQRGRHNRAFIRLPSRTAMPPSAKPRRSASIVTSKPPWTTRSALITTTPGGPLPSRLP